MSPSLKPKFSEKKFLLGADKKHGSTGSNAIEIFGYRPRLPKYLGEKLQILAWKRRMSLNALIIDLLERGALDPVAPMDPKTDFK